MASSMLRGCSTCMSVMRSCLRSTKRTSKSLLLTQLAACLFHRNEEIWAPRWHKVGKATRTAFHLYTTILKT